jgi:hypothetical protein
LVFEAEILGGGGGGVLAVTVFDHDVVGRHDLLGEAAVPLDALLCEQVRVPARAAARCTLPPGATPGERTQPCSPSPRHGWGPGGGGASSRDGARPRQAMPLAGASVLHPLQSSADPRPGHPR